MSTRRSSTRTRPTAVSPPTSTREIWRRAFGLPRRSSREWSDSIVALSPTRRLRSVGSSRAGSAAKARMRDSWSSSRPSTSRRTGSAEVAEILVVATGGAGGDLPPLLAASLALRDRGHEVTFVGDASVEHVVAPFHLAVDVLPKEVDLGPRIARVAHEAMQATAGDRAKAGPMIQRGLTVWAHDVARPLS